MEPKTAMLQMDDIFTDEDFNCRGAIVPIDVVDLAKSIEAQGQLTPVIVTPLKEAREGKKYLLVAGYRRYTACAVLKKLEIWASIREDLDDRSMRFINLKENTERKALNIVQEARAIARLKAFGICAEDVARELGVSRGWVQIRFQLLDLPQEIQAEAINGVIKQNDIRTLAQLRDPTKQIEAAKRIKEIVQRGEKRQAAAVQVKAKSIYARRGRNKVEVERMMFYIQSQLGNGLHTRTMAWMCGNINDNELFQDLETFATEKGKTFTRPQEDEY